MSESLDRKVLVCQNTTCLKQGAEAVYSAFQAASPVPVLIAESGCLGQCGNGPMVLVLPEQVWYSRVQPEEVPIIIEQHLIKGQPVASMLYRKFHPGVTLPQKGRGLRGFLGPLGNWGNGIKL